MDALIGHTGFVGMNLLRQRSFDYVYNSKNIEDIRNQDFELIICAGIPATKWLANKDPGSDWKNIKRMLDNLTQVTASNFILVSTIDVYPLPLGVDETTDPTGQPNHPYGLHRLAIESFVRERFRNFHFFGCQVSSDRFRKRMSSTTCSMTIAWTRSTPKVATSTMAGQYLD